MKIVDIKNIQIADTPHKVAVKKLFNFEHATIVHIELKLMSCNVAYYS